MKLLRRIGALLKKKWVIGLIGVGVIIFIVSRFAGGNGDDGYELAYPERGTVVAYVTETGNVVSSSAVPVYSTTNGIIQELYTQNGMAVSAKDPLFTVTSTATDQEKSTAWSNYLAAKTALDAAKSTEYSLQASMFGAWDQYRDKYEDDQYEDEGDQDRNEPDFQVPQKEWLAAESAYKNQQQVVSQKQADLNAKWLAYQATQDSTVNAQIAGTVENLAVVTGQHVSASTAFTTASPVLLLTTNAVPTLKVDINETDYALIAVGQPATIAVDALENELYTGEVSRVDAVGTDTQGVITYGVYLTVDGAIELLHQGMTATVDIEVAHRDDVITVPASAVKPYQGGRAVQVLRDGVVEFVPVEIGVRGTDTVEILSGIDESTEIITAIKNENIQRSGGLFGG